MTGVRCDGRHRLLFRIECERIEAGFFICCDYILGEDDKLTDPGLAVGGYLAAQFRDHERIAVIDREYRRANADFNCHASIAS